MLRNYKGADKTNRITKGGEENDVGNYTIDEEEKSFHIGSV